MNSFKLILSIGSKFHSPSKKVKNDTSTVIFDKKIKKIIIVVNPEEKPRGLGLDYGQYGSKMDIR